eukprot:6570540-Lingulodinium_polyedra.AAC.1
MSLMGCIKQRLRGLLKWRRKWHPSCRSYMGEEKTILYASGGSSYFHPGGGVVPPWGPSTDDDHYLKDLNLYFVDKLLAEKASE